jgi:hypothetical protein
MKRSAALLSIVLSAAIPCAAGIVYEIEVRDHEQSPPKSESTEVAVEGRNLAMEVLPGEGGRGRGTMIYRGDRREMVVVDHDDQSYIVMDEQTMSQLGAQVDQAMAMMDEALANVPADQRDKIREMMQQQMPQAQAAPERPKNELKKTSETATHNGYPCRKYEVYRDGRKTQELWVTEWSNIEGGAEVADVFHDMSEFFKELLDSIPKFGQSGADEPFFEFMQELGGFPVVTKEFGDDGYLEEESTLRSARRRSLDPDAFEPPSGYKRRQMFGPQ